MGLPVVTVAAGGLPVVDVTASLRGTPVTEAANGRGVAVTKVAAGKAGMPVVYETIGVAAPVTYATLDGFAVNVTLTNGNLTATHNSAATNSGARSLAFKGNGTPGRYYFEVKILATHGNNDAVSFVTAATAYSQVISGLGGPIAFAGANGLLFNAGATTGKTLGTWVANDVICFAIHLTATTALSWFRRNNGFWNGDSAADPANDIGGLPGGIGADGAPTLVFGGAGSALNDAMQANFGASAFTGAVPSGFTAGWPA